MKDFDNFMDEVLVSYAEDHTSSENELLYDLNRKTHLYALMPRMLSGKIQGKFLNFLIQMYQPKRVLEVGTYTGYSAIEMASALPSDGLLYTLDINEEREDFVRQFFNRAGLTDKIIFKIGDAVQLIPHIDEKWDFVFIDADKEHNQLYYDLIIDQVKPGGFILVDNVLWNYKVLDDACQDKVTKCVRDFNSAIQRDDRVENVLLPLRDGLMMIRKL